MNVPVDGFRRCRVAWKATRCFPCLETPDAAECWPWIRNNLLDRKDAEKLYYGVSTMDKYLIPSTIGTDSQYYRSEGLQLVTELVGMSLLSPATFSRVSTRAHRCSPTAVYSMLFC